MPRDFFASSTEGPEGAGGGLEADAVDVMAGVLVVVYRAGASSEWEQE